MNDGTLTAQRDSRGRFLPGNKYNPGRGRRPRDKAIRDAFREWCPDARAVLVQLMLDETARPADRIRAAEIILDRGMGKPRQCAEVDLIGDLRTLDLTSLSDQELLALAEGGED